MTEVKPKVSICVVCDQSKQAHQIFQDLELSKDFVLATHFFEAVLLVNQNADFKTAPVQIHYQKIEEGQG